LASEKMSCRRREEWKSSVVGYTNKMNKKLIKQAGRQAGRHRAGREIYSIEEKTPGPM
jgi:hypothetical protein